MMIDGHRAMDRATELLLRYYSAFNRGDWSGMLGCIAADVVHDINQGGREVGKDAFRTFLARMHRCYREELHEIVVVADAHGKRAAAEYVVQGEYLADDDGLPSARGQRYVLPGGAFFEIRDNQIARVTNYYNRADWLRQIAA